MNDCKDALTFDTNAVKSDYLALSSILSFVSRDNYDEAREKWGATIPEYFSGDFESFSTKRSRLTTLFAESNLVAISGEHFRRTLSPDAARNYAECLASQSDDPIVAWVSEYNDEYVVITTQNRMTDVKVLCRVVGNTQPVEPSTELVTGASEALAFPWIPRNGLTVSINVKNVASGNTLKGVVIQVPQIIKFEQRQETRLKSVVIRAGAGGDGSTAASPLYGNGALIADLGFTIHPETLVQAPPSGQGGLTPTLQWTAIKAGDQIVRFEGQVTHAEADNGDTQRIVDYTFSVVTTREYLVESGVEALCAGQCKVGNVPPLAIGP